jgi:hypothetical protein
LSGIQRDREPFVREDAIDAPGHELPAPGLPVGIGIGDGQLDFYALEMLVVGTLDEGDVAGQMKSSFYRERSRGEGGRIAL